MTAHDSGQLTLLLERGKSGDESAVDEFLRLAYPSLKRLAAAALRDEWLSKTQQRTIVVHEALLRLFRDGWSQIPWQNRAEFFAGAAREMRQIVIEHARRRKALKRGVDYVIVPFDEDGTEAGGAIFHRLIEIHDALNALELVDARCATIVDLMFFSGFTREEAAGALRVHVRTVERDWKFAKAFLKSALSE
jgi:RNA polymerase sigma factor (TIGR02999 family)